MSQWHSQTHVEPSCRTRRGQIRKQPSLGDGAKCPKCRAQQSQVSATMAAAESPVDWLSGYCQLMSIVGDGAI